LLLQHGEWQGKQLVPAEWFEAATSKQVPNDTEENPDWKQGYGAGVFAIATVFQLRLDVAHGQGRGTRVHFSAGLSF